MTSDFSPLSDVEFESFVGDLLGEDTGVHFERFSRGKDGGVDLRASDSAGTHIVQCKHYQKSSYSNLLRSLRDELPHVLRENPATYRVAVSESLSRARKDEIFGLFEGWMPNPSYVLGGDDLDALTTRYPNVERRYVKLWLTSGGALSWAVNAGVHNRSDGLLDRIGRAIPRYVENSSFAEAAKILDEQHVAIVSGPPGIGKTMLAHLLLAAEVKAGYEPFEISNDIEEGWRTYDASARQVFLYDDFLGRVSFAERLQKNEDHRLTNFVDRVRAAKSKRLILTTREYVLEDARQTYEELDRLDSRMSLVMELASYSRIDRARILYNHLWHSDMAAGDLDDLISDRNYLRIVDHPNFNPRMIEYITRPPIAGP